MKKIIILFVFFSSILTYGQSKRELADVYFKKSERALEAADFPLAKTHFERGVAKIGEVNTANNALTGALVYLELKEYEQAKKYVDKFFQISKNRSSDDYKLMLEVSVTVDEAIIESTAKEEKIKKEKLEKEKELKRIEALKKEWEEKAEDFTFDFDMLYPFNKYGVAVYEKNGYYGAINDRGIEVVEASIYKKVLNNEGYILFLNKEKSPTKILSINTKTKYKVQLPQAFTYVEDLTNYGVVTKPRGNGQVVMYSEELGKTMLYDLEEERFLKTVKLKDKLKKLKKDDKIDKYKDRIVRIDKNKYRVGTFIGSGVYSLYKEGNGALFGYMFTENQGDRARVRVVAETGFLTAFHDKKLEGIKEDDTLVWYTKGGQEANKSQFDDSYEGDVEIEKSEKGGYRLTKDGVVFIKGKTLEKLADFIEKNSTK
ncbi:hypothetical protein [Tenacibaculum insulae]|uniref:hypothetical protein n=1 Tax=Tenacibaculum insulae TaxID=2029677 RepID=UPI003AB6F23A